VRLDDCIVLCPSFLFCTSDQYVLRSCFFLLGASHGFPSSTSHLFLHATACRLRLISTASPFRVLLCCLRWAIKASASAEAKSRSCTSSSGCTTTLAAYRILCLRFARLVHRSFGSATDTRLNTGGWLALTRRGLSPRKMRRALLGAKWHLLKLLGMSIYPDLIPCCMTGFNEQRKEFRSSLECP